MKYLPQLLFIFSITMILAGLAQAQPATRIYVATTQQ
ncbi:hypothetical protein BXY39_3731 [Eilatimonas milleporae]|uniref:Uncharacterized protein n=1 Tax=Eilatimonas milleporae TaxID=911205 RepID=A0A3M0CER8_9PROT|nr:hypothetical protein BXY39_3731 [Eilatimonas milleporae]